jgi:predicted AAA+ superfamily ATPase
MFGLTFSEKYLFSGLTFYHKSSLSDLIFYYLCRRIHVTEIIMYIKRNIDRNLQDWKQSVSRKPLLLRGARQVGKSSSVREFGKQFEYFVEVNFERKEHQDAKKIFERSSSPKHIADELFAMLGIPVVAGRTLLFLDEIQSCIPAISSLRFFYEDMPELHVIAAGSLLEFALEEVPSYGVGRIRSLFMYPLSFDEYLRAIGFNALSNRINISSPHKPLSDVLHHQCLTHLIKYIVLGGMPQVVATLAQGGSLQDCQQVLDDLILTFDDDFAKYKARVPSSRLREVFLSVMEQTGNKFVYSHASQIDRHEQIKEAVDLLAMAGLIYPVTHTSANGIPLAAQFNHKFRKYAVFDTGLMQRCLQLDISDILLGDTLFQINKGAIAELYTGLEIIKSMPCHQPAQLYYWQREHHGSQAEIDYIVQNGREIIPLEVKAGTKGAMQSLHLFMEEKNSIKGIRTSLENFGKTGNIEIYPLYAVANIISPSQKQ